MPTNLTRIHTIHKTGKEPFHFDERPVGLTLLNFWQWSASDLVCNSTRGILAEFIVASALGISQDGVRDEWGAYDLITCDGITIEVKSAAYIQSWNQRNFSSIIFDVKKTRAWTADTNLQEKEIRRQAQVYVFALLAHKDKATIDPLNVSQWRFYVLPTSVLNNRTRSQHSITIPSLEKLAGSGISYDRLQDAIHEAAAKNQA